MRRIFRDITIFALCIAMACPTIEARGRNNNATPAQQQPTRPGTSTRPQQPSQQPSRPQQQPGRPQQPQRPPQAQQPARPPQHQQPQRPPQAHYPMPPSHVRPVAPPRPQLPPMRPYQRPIAPSWYHPTPGSPVISTILGVALGTAINASIHALINSGHNVTGYTNDVIYLDNVSQLNMMWPHATLYYNNYGGLVGSQFVYSTPVYDTTRYYQAYQRLVTNYGAPVTSTAGYTLSASWWGYNGQYVTLTYGPQVAANGMTFYYTTLAFGN